MPAGHSGFGFVMDRLLNPFNNAELSDIKKDIRE
jgi:hypothetical protein